MPRSPLEHTADTGLEATAASLEGLIEELATGMFELMATVDPCPDASAYEMRVAASSVEDLVVDALSELLYLSETEDLHFCRFDVRLTGKDSLQITVSGVSTGETEHSGPSIKAVTYHDLEVSETGGGWYGRVYFDV